MGNAQWRIENADSMKAYRRKHYRLNKAQYRANVSSRRREIKAWIVEVKKGLKCIRCGENHPATLDFHHRDPAAKEFSVAAAIKRGMSKERIVEEMGKCDVLCSNCHRKEHARVI